MDKVQIRRSALTQQIANSENLLLETDLAVVMKDKYPKAQYHFLVLPKADIERVTALTHAHLPLLDHMHNLANEMIEKQQHLPSSSFIMGFKMDPFMNRLILHVISNDFFSINLRKTRHWNIFNTALFLPFQAAYAMLLLQGSIEALPSDKTHELRNATTFNCNQCKFSTSVFLCLKSHLAKHWSKREQELELKQQVNKVMQMLDKVQLDNAPVPDVVDELKSSDMENAMPKVEHKVSHPAEQQQPHQNCSQQQGSAGLQRPNRPYNTYHRHPNMRPAPPGQPHYSNRRTKQPFQETNFGQCPPGQQLLNTAEGAAARPSHQQQRSHFNPFKKVQQQPQSGQRQHGPYINYQQPWQSHAAQHAQHRNGNAVPSVDNPSSFNQNKPDWKRNQQHQKAPHGQQQDPQKATGQPAKPIKKKWPAKKQKQKQQQNNGQQQPPPNDNKSLT